MDPAQNQPPPAQPPVPPPPVQPGQPIPNTNPATSTEISLDEAKKLEHNGGSSKKRKLVVIIAIAIVLFIVLCIGLVILTKPAPKKPQPKPTPTPTPTPLSKVMLIDTTHHEQILVPYVPHFLDMKLSDVIKLSDIRSIFNYKDHLVIVAFSGIIELNPKTNEFIRQNDPRVFKCINYATLIDNTLYVACNGWDMSDRSDKGIYAINLDTGKLDKRYTPGIISFDNVTVASNKDTLWVGGRNELASLDTKTGKIDEYDFQTVGVPSCRDATIFDNGATVWITCRPDSATAVAILDPLQNKWTPYAPASAGNTGLITLGYTLDSLYFLSQTDPKIAYTYHLKTNTADEAPAGSLRIPSSKPEALEMRGTLQADVIFNHLGQDSIAYLSYYDIKQKKVADFDLFVHPYIGMTDVVNQKRYLFTQNTIDTIKKDQFPIFTKKLTANLTSAMRAYVDPLENYALVIGPTNAATSSGALPFSAQLIDIKSGVTTDLLTNNDTLRYVDPEKLALFAANLGNTTLVGKDNGAQLKDIRTGKTWIDVNFTEKKLIYNNY